MSDFPDSTAGGNSNSWQAIIDAVFGCAAMGTGGRCSTTVTISRRVRAPVDVINDPASWEERYVVPLEGAGAKLEAHGSSPIQVRDVRKVHARRARKSEEHSEEVLPTAGVRFTISIERMIASGVVHERRAPATGS